MTQEEKAKAYDEALQRTRRWYDSNTNEGYRAIFEDIFPELKESKDEKIRKVIYGWIYTQPSQFFDSGFSKEEMLAWLEKQGEQKSIIEMKTPEESLGIDSNTYNKIVDECIYGEQKPEGKTALEAAKEEKVDNANKIESKDYSSIDPHFFKTTDKVEPKFHVNEWVVTDKNDVVQIKAVNNGYYTIDNGMDFSIPYVDRYWHKWTIQDAKPGDVLVNQNGEMPFIFKECKNNHIYCYCGYTNRKDMFFDMFVDSKGEELHWLNLYHEQAYPATKAQRNLLFQKMKKSGYEWDTEKKELKKIEQLPIDVRTTGYWHVENVEQKPAWSEDDERIRHSLIIDLSNAQTDDEKVQNEINKEINWLKSLKERVQLQNRWKPSEEQMEALEDAIRYGEEENIGILSLLYNDLKKLREEWFGNSHVRTVSEMMAFTAKHFFELGLKAQKGE